MSSWSAPDFLDQLKTLLDARASLTSLTPEPKVLTYWPSASEPLTDSIILPTASDDTERVVMNPTSNPSDEIVAVDGVVWVFRPGAGEEAAKAARDRAQVLLNELADQLRTTPPAVVHSGRAWIADRDMDQRPSDSEGAPGRACVLEFTIRYRARTTTS